jgi:hypothetical protein
MSNMADTSRTLDLDEDRLFQERYWSFQRFAWVLFLFVVVGALCGLTGSGGPFSRATVEGAGGARIIPASPGGKREMMCDLS